MPTTRSTAGTVLRCAHGHFEWADFELKTLPDGSYALWVACDLPSADGIAHGHYLAEVAPGAFRVQMVPHRWHSAVEAFEARDRWAAQER